MVRVDLITGFLGSGKTTFIKKYVKYLTSALNENICILENDYGAINVDAMLLSDIKSDKVDVEMVAGGCDADCHRRRFKTKLITMAMLGYSRVIIEPSGIFDIDEFMDVMNEEPLNRMYRIENIICILRADLPEELSVESENVLAAEAADAGIIVMSRTLDADHDQILRTVEHVNRALASVKCERRFAVGGVNAASDTLTLNSNDSINAASDTLTLNSNDKIHAASAEISNDGIPAASSADISNVHSEKSAKGFPGRVLIRSWDSLTDDEFRYITESGYVKSSFVKNYSMDDSGFDSLFFMNVEMDPEDILTSIRKLFKDKECGNVIRVKGFLQADITDKHAGCEEADVSKKADLKGNKTAAQDPKAPVSGSEVSPGWKEINATENKLTVTDIPAGQKCIIVIGEGLDKEKIDKYFNSEFSSNRLLSYDKIVY
jgi:G3E family GTPase